MLRHPYKNMVKSPVSAMSITYMRDWQLRPGNLPVRIDQSLVSVSRYHKNELVGFNKLQEG